MAKNKTSTGAFDVSDLADNAEKNIGKIHSQTGTAKADRRAVKRETKSKRVNLLVRPSVYEAVVRKAEAEGVSVNELINSIMENLVQE